MTFELKNFLIDKCNINLIFKKLTLNKEKWYTYVEEIRKILQKVIKYKKYKGSAINDK